MPKGSAKSWRKVYFESDGKTYGIRVPADYDDRATGAAVEDAMASGQLSPIPRTAPFEDRTPVDVAPIFGSDEPDAPLWAQNTPKNVPLNEREIRYAKKGVLTGRTAKDFSFEDMTRLNTAATQAEMAMAIGEMVRQKVGAPSHFDATDFVRNEDGELAYFDMQTKHNPKGTNRWVLFENSFLRNPWEMAKAGAGVAGYAVGAVPGMITGSPGGVQLGGAVGSALATAPIETYRIGKGMEEGVNVPIEGRAAMAGAKEGALVGGTSFAADAIMGKLARSGRINSYFFDSAYAPEFEQGLARTADDVARINELSGGTGRFDPGAAKRSGVRELMDLEATLAAKQSTKQSEGITEAIRKRDAESWRALDSAIDNLSNPGAPVDRTQVGVDLKAATGRDSFEPVARAAKNEAAIRREMSRFEQGRPTSMPEEQLQAIRGAVRGSREAAELEENLAWAEVEDRIAASLQPTGKITEMPRYELIDQLLVDIRPWNANIDSLAQRWARAKATLFPSGAEQQFGSFMDTITGLVDRREPVGLTKLMNGIKQLRQIERESLSRKGPYKVDEAFLQELEGTLVAIRDDYLSKYAPDVRQALARAEEATRETTDMYYRTILESVTRDVPLSVDNPALGPTEVLGRIMTPGSGRNAQVVMSAIRQDPSAVRALQEAALQRYIREVYTPNGIVDPRKYMDFMSPERYGPAMREILSPDDWGKIQRIGGLGEALETAVKRSAAAEKAFKNTFRGKIDKMNAEAITDSFFKTGGLNNNETHNLVQFLGRNQPELLAEVQLAVRQEMRNRGLRRGAGQPHPSLANLNAMIGNNEAKMRILFGNQYVQDLQTVKRMVELMERKGQAINIPTATPALSMFRVIFGPLSRAQRFISASKQFQIAGYEKALFNILSDPVKLRTAVANGNKPVNGDMMAPILAQLGIQFADDDQN